MLQSATLKMSLVVMPAFAAAVTEALRTECALKVSVLMPAFDSIVFSHLAMVDELAGWCSLIVAINSFEVRSLKASVRFSYARSVLLDTTCRCEGRPGRKSLSYLCLFGQLCRCTGYPFWEVSSES